ncbi:hypothetical protein BDN72DRAFT_833338 [Pluteus cervinus]|uniref:Uncharacterized protein n=1 Tax=Pluteus cervinus TaxID=181527 RepID=A0ACD3BA34_9AGAR|nr:hypothetical protein BDN72DRAFT_833338 [Pluteus cervinus]
MNIRLEKPRHISAPALIYPSAASTDMPVTFAVNDVQAANLGKQQTATTASEVITNARRKQAYINDFLCSSFGARANSAPLADSNGRAVVPNVNGLLNTSIMAYNLHHNLSIRPDDVWLCMLSQLSLYVTAHAEEMRSQFVSHDGSKTLEVVRDGTRFSVDWEGIVDEFMDQMKGHLKDPEIQTWLTPTFSTTTQSDIVAANVSVMAIMSKYFDYSVMTMCGLPSVTLEGTREDWVELKQKAERLTLFGREELTRWHGVLTPIFDNFIRVFDGQIDVEGFWNHMVKYKGGSGGPSISGWIGYFAAFDEDGKWQLYGGQRSGDTRYVQPLWLNWTGSSSLDYWQPNLRTAKIPNGSVEVKVDINDNGSKHEGRFVAGLLGWQWEQEKKTINPYVGWALYTVDNAAMKQAAERQTAQEGRRTFGIGRR